MQALRSTIESAVEALIAVLDAMDDDPDLEAEPDLEDGADAEPDLHHVVPQYADEGHDQTRFAQEIPGIVVSPLGAR